MTGFRVLAVEEILRGRRVVVERTTLAAPDGSEFVREIVRHEGAVCVVPMLGDRVVLIRQFRAPAGAPLIEIPAGTRDVDGEPPIDTARRECEEEVGYRPGTLTELGRFFTAPGFTDELMWLYVAEDLERVDARPEGAEERAAEIMEVPLAEAIGLIDAGEIVDAKTIIGLRTVAARR